MANRAIGAGYALAERVLLEPMDVHHSLSAIRRLSLCRSRYLYLLISFFFVQLTRRTDRQPRP